jgi:Peptidase family M1 domain
MLDAPLGWSEEGIDAADYHYYGDMTINPDSGYISLNWQISVVDAYETTITFMLRNTLENIILSGDAVKEVSVTTPANQGPFHYIEITLNPQQGQELRVINIGYDGVLLPEPMENRINTIASDYVELNVDSFWHPIDSRFDKHLTAEMDVHIGEGWTGLTTGNMVNTADGGSFINEIPSLDIPFAFSKSFRVYQYDNFTLYDHRPNDYGIDELEKAAQNCFAYLNGQFGDRMPLPTGRFLLTTRESSGYSRKNYIALTDIGETEPVALTQFVCHELAHYWSSGGNFGTVENWLNETFADYVANMAMRETFGEDAFVNRMERYVEQIEDKELPAIWITDGSRERLPYLVNYRKGPLLLYRLEKRIGADRFSAFLYRYMVGGINTTPDLIAALKDTAGQAARDWFVDELSK